MDQVQVDIYMKNAELGMPGYELKTEMAQKRSEALAISEFIEEYLH